MREIGVGLVGYGYAGSVFHAPLIESVPGLRLVAVASSNEAKLRADRPKVSRDGTPEALFARPEVGLVVIATPNDTHFDLARRALQAGKHVVVDKPFTVTLAEAEELAQLASHAGLLLSVFHNRRWDSDFLTLRRLLNAARLGEVTHFESRFDRYRPLVRDRWRERAGPASGLWYDLGPHLVDQALQLFGMPSAVEAALEMQRHGAQTVDYFRVQLKYPRLRVVLQAGMLGIDDGPRFVVQGSRGHYLKCGLDIQEEALKRGELPAEGARGLDGRPGVLTLLGHERDHDEIVPGEPGTYVRYYEAVRDAIAGRGANPVTAEEAVQCMRVIALACESQRLGRTVTF